MINNGVIYVRTWDNVGACKWLLCMCNSILATRGAAAVINPILKPLLTTFDIESNRITRPSVSSDRNDFGCSWIQIRRENIFHKAKGTLRGHDRLK